MQKQNKGGNNVRKEDLKDGMIIKFAEGSWWVLEEGVIRLIGGTKYSKNYIGSSWDSFALSNYTDDLTHISDLNLSIVKMIIISRTELYTYLANCAHLDEYYLDEDYFVECKISWQNDSETISQLSRKVASLQKILKFLANEKLGKIEKKISEYPTPHVTSKSLKEQFEDIGESK